MQITAIECHKLLGATVDGGWPAGHEPQDDLHTLVEVHTDEGLSGIGSVFTGSALTQAGVDFLEPVWRNAAADQPQRVSESLRQSSFWQGRGGTVEHVISGIDIALWDLFGKICNQPVSKLLGGNYRRRIKPYGSMLFDEPGILSTRLREVVDRGFQAIKLGWRPFGRRDDAFDEKLVATARDTVGPDVTLLVDAGGSEQFWPHDYKWALRTSQMLAEYGVEWFEEPLAADDIRGYIKLREHSPVPIAAGEVLTRRQAFMPWIESHAVDIIQPDVTKCGGLTEALRIARMAEDHHVKMVSHGWNTAVGLAADLQLAAAMPNAYFVEYLTPAAYIEDIVVDKFEIDEEGYLQIPQAPGLGIELDRDALSRFSGE